MWKLTQIPKKLHLFWSGGSLPYLRYLTAYTFKKLNPDWEINLWTSQIRFKTRTWNTHELNYAETWEDWTDKFYKLCDNIYAVDFKSEFGIENHISEVHKSDLLRYWFLNKEGGVYSDTDIFYFRPITTLEVNNGKNRLKETFVCISIYGHSNGFFMAAKGSDFFKYMFAQAKMCDLKNYQSNGPDLCNRLFPDIESIAEISPVADIGMDAVYFYNARNIDRIYKENRPMFHANSIGCHWYAGHPLSGNFLNNTNGGLKNLPDNIIGKLCSGFLS